MRVCRCVFVCESVCVCVSASVRVCERERHGVVWDLGLRVQGSRFASWVEDLGFGLEVES